MDIFNRTWIIDNALEELSNYRPGELTLRGLHYRLVSRGMTNTLKHYKRVVQAMIKARWEGIVDFEAFSDHDRRTIGSTDNEETNVDDAVSEAEDAIEGWMKYYHKNKWERQPKYVEVWVEKKAMIGTFSGPCTSKGVLLFPCKGYPSLTLLNQAANRFIDQSDKECKILYFGDYDASGENIPDTIGNNLRRLGADVEIKRVLLTKEDVISMGLPPAPSKSSDPRTANWDGLGQVELDAVEPKLLKQYIRSAVEEEFDMKIYSELLADQEEEKAEYRRRVKDFVINLADNLE